MTLDPIPSFRDFYEELHHRKPLPWQGALAAQVANDGGWPTDIGIPTGLGKTACLSIAVWALASQLESEPRRLPTRVWYVVNRRLLVDAAYDQAIEMAKRLRDDIAEPTAVGAVGRRLAAMGAVKWDTGPLHVTRLRGGAAMGHRLPDPSQPGIVLATVPQFGSRLLFRGYGVSTGLRPIDACHAGTDSLILLDEAHLSAPLQKLIRQLGDFPPPEIGLIPEARRLPTLVNLTATGKTGATFDLSEADFENSIVQQRLSADKPTLLRPVADRAVPAEMAESAVALAAKQLEAGRMPATVVFVNTASRAPLVRKEVEKAIKKSSLPDDTRLVTLTGRMRSVDAARLVEELTADEDSVASGRAATPPRPRPLFVVATQTLEVGADFDFDCLVTESAGVRSLTQRLGRLNRLGEKPWAKAVIVHADDRSEWPVYGTEPADVWDRLLGSQPLDAETVNLGPADIRNVLGEPNPDPDISPELLPNHLRDWAKTSLRRDLEAPIEPFFSGEDEDLRTATVIWRRVLPRDVAGLNAKLRPLPSSQEAVDIPVGELRRFLGDKEAYVYSADTNLLSTLAVDAIRPGMIIVVPTAAGGYLSDRGWDPESNAEVPDVSAEVRPEVVVVPELLTSSDSDAWLQPPNTDEPEKEAERYAEVLRQAQAAWSGGSWVRADDEVSSTESRQALQEILAPGVVIRGVRGGPLILTTSATEFTSAPVVESDDELSTLVDLGSDRSALGAHLALVGGTAGEIARHIGLDLAIVEAVELAGRAHDLGKADLRFQLRLGAPDGVLMAKSTQASSTTSVPAAWPRGGRHEALSAQLVEQWRRDNEVDPGIDFDLVLHLVLSHHGHGRPLVPGVADAAPVDLNYEVEGSQVAIVADLARIDWGQPERFERLNRRYGPWGLALLEAVLRQADHAESAQADDTQRKPREVL